MRKSQPTLPANRAFVVQFRAPVQGQPQGGRVEHMLSGQSRRFKSPDQLLAFMEQMLSEIKEPPGRPLESPCPIPGEGRKVQGL